MIQHKSLNYLLEKTSTFNQIKLGKIKTALESIARKNGEDEYYAIDILNEKRKIEIGLDEVKTLRNRYIWIWITIPYKENTFLKIQELNDIYNLPKKDYIKLLEIDNNKFIKFVEKIEICAVFKDVFEILKEKYDINSTFLNENEWIYIQNTNIWNEAEIQTARELIAEKLLNQ
ncbi:MAG: hypothetical protein JXA99_04475 [Candidatus Lokiarchaeota archaeon]|nr:hypothetical protein [Candidatus Lokiarchaeota archaeon]